MNLWLRTTFSISFDVEVPTPLILKLRVRSGAQQWVARESYIVNPSVPVVEYVDSYGNPSQRLTAPPGAFSIHHTCTVQTTDHIDVCMGGALVEVQDLPDDVLPYLLPTRYCESDKFVDMAHAIVGNVTPGYNQVAAIVTWIQDNVEFNPASMHYQMSATEVNLQREGVCRELAHLGIALCRALCIPTRIVVGYLYGLKPMDLHAWFEAYVGGRWYSFDPTQAEPQGGRVIVAYGRDAADVAIYNQYGPALILQTMDVSVEKLENAPI